VRAKVVEPVADARFGNNYNKTALFRMLEIGLLCVQASARQAARHEHRLALAARGARGAGARGGGARGAVQLRLRL